MKHRFRWSEQKFARMEVSRFPRQVLFRELTVEKRAQIEDTQLKATLKATELEPKLIETQGRGRTICQCSITIRTKTSKPLEEK